MITFNFVIFKVNKKKQKNILKNKTKRMRITFAVFSCFLITLEILHSVYAAERIFTIDGTEPRDPNPENAFGKIPEFESGKKYAKFPLQPGIRYFEKENKRDNIFVSFQESPGDFILIY